MIPKTQGKYIGTCVAMGIVYFTFVSLLTSNFVYGLPPPFEEMQKIKQEYSEKLSKISAMKDKPPPHKQIEDGISPEDVLCSDDHILMLKWADVKSACVFPETSNKLVQRGWGVIREEFNIIPLADCVDYFNIFYETENHNHSKIIKILRDELRTLDENAWYPINLSHDDESDFIIMNPEFSSHMEDLITQIDNVSHIEHDMAQLCV